MVPCFFDNQSETQSKEKSIERKKEKKEKVKKNKRNKKKHNIVIVDKFSYIDPIH